MKTRIIRTEKLFIKDNVFGEFMRKALSIGGLHKYPLKADLNDFKVTDRVSHRHDSFSAENSRYEGQREGWHKHLSSVEIKLEGFDTRVVIWQNGRMQGYFNSGKTQYAGDPIEWINLLLRYGFLKIEEYD